MPNIETITDNLENGYQRLEKGTFQESAEIQFQRRADEDLRNIWLYTANLPLFRGENNTLEYALEGRRAFDLIAGANIAEFARQVKSGAYKLTPEQVEQLQGLSVAWLKAADLKLHKENDEWSYFLIDTSDLTASALNDSQRVIAERAHGSLTDKTDKEQELPDYGETMKMLQSRIAQTRIWLPTSRHIQNYTAGKKVVGRASWLDFFGYVSNFLADFRLVGYHFGLRGVRKVEAAEGSGAENLVTLPEQKMLVVLGNYLGPVSLEQAKADLRKIYK